MSPAGKCVRQRAVRPAGKCVRQRAVSPAGKCVRQQCVRPAGKCVRQRALVHHCLCVPTGSQSVHSGNQSDVCDNRHTGSDGDINAVAEFDSAGVADVQQKDPD